MDYIIRWIRRKIPLIWQFVEKLNELIVGQFYQKKAAAMNEAIESSILTKPFLFSSFNTNQIVSFKKYFYEISEIDRKYFNPFNFDPESISKILNNKSYLMYGIKKDDELLGIFFLRLFLNKTAYLGFHVDSRLRGQGIGTAMVAAMAKACKQSSIRLFSTVAKHNVSSYKAHIKNGFVVIKEMDNDYMLLKHDINTLSD